MSVFFIVDLRPEWSRKPYITLWRPDNAGYACALPWAGKYTPETIAARPTYYVRHGLTPSGNKRKSPIRFPVPCDVVEGLAIAKPAIGITVGYTGPVLVNDEKTRQALRRAAYRPQPNRVA